VLVLTRRAGESIVIGDEVRVVVLEVRGDTVRLGIEAPRSVQVHRAEVYAEVQAANAAAAGGTADELGAAAARLQQLARPRPPRQRGSARLERLNGAAPASANGPASDAAAGAPASGPPSGPATAPTSAPGRPVPGPPKPAPPRP
jgi:carbon storage regulator